MKTSLPNADFSDAGRSSAVAARRDALAYDYSRFQGIAMLSSVPRWAHPVLGWVEQVGEVLARIAVNSHKASGRMSKMHPDHADHLGFRALLADAEKGGISAAFDALVEISPPELDTTRAQRMEDYEALFATLPLPPSASDFRDDRAFARMRLAGPNPMTISRVTRLPEGFGASAAHVARASAALTAQGRDVTGLDLEAALAEGRAFTTDYRALAGSVTGKWPGGSKHLAAPLALFVTAGAGRELLPVAIQLGPEGGPIFTPADGKRWAMAKSFVNIADGHEHQALVHLSHTHLVIEACAIAMYRNISESHPVHQLLHPHFEGTFFINDAAESSLTRSGGGVDRIMAATIAECRQVAIQGVLTWDFAGSMLEADLRARGVDDRSTLPSYPFRDDARLVHGAIRDWVESFLRIWYRTDAMVAQDQEVQAMFRELASPEGGRIRGVPRIDTVMGLAEAVAHVIFTASAQHAAVNFPQLPIMSFAPAFPLAAYVPPPGAEEPSERAWVEMMPPIQLAEVQLSLGTMLGSVHHTKLGDYHVELLGHFAHDARTAEPLAAFRTRLADIERTIAGRNEGRPAYPYLLPSRIPQSINI